jgi:archaemetzincin
MKHFLLFVALVIVLSCHNKEQEKSVKKITAPAKRTAAIKVVPLGKTTPQFISETFAAMKLVLPDAILLSKEEMPAAAWYAPRKRYRADTLIHWLSSQAKENETFVGITMGDISTTKGDVFDYGVMGLGFCPGNACVASSFRLKNKKDFIKVVVHELGHTTGLPHCPDKTCYMRDAEGGDHSDKEKGFCESCKKHLLSNGWKL